MKPSIRRELAAFSLVVMLLIVGVLSPRVSAGSPISSLSATQSSQPSNSSELYNAVRLTWTTGYEVDLAGFNVYRGAALEGPFVKVNASLIPAQRDALGGGDYAFDDVSASDKFVYVLETITLNGTSGRHGPVLVTRHAESDPLDQLLALLKSVLHF